MGEEVEKKAEKDEEKKSVEEEAKEEESKKPEEDQEKKKTEEPKEPPPPQEIVLRVYMHCEGCAKKVRKCLRGFQGVEDVETDCKAHKVIVKGEKADPLKVLGVLQRKCHRQVELVSPIPKPKTEEEKKSEEAKENVKPEEKKPEVITAVLRVHMHCDACAQKIQKCILRMKGVETANVDMKSSQVTVKGGFEAPKLVEYLHKKTGKHAAIVKTEPEAKKEEKSENEEEKKKKKKKKSEGGDNEEEKNNKDGSGEEQKQEEQKSSEEELTKADEGAKMEREEEREGETKVVAELLRAHELYHHPVPVQFNAPYHHPIQFHTEYVYPPQMFSDENPNACSIM